MDAYMAFWEKRAEMDNIRNIYAYILSIVKNRTLNYLEHRKVVAEALEKIQEHSERELNFRIDTLRACEPEELFSEEVRSIVERGLNRVSDLDARIFKMSKLDDKTNKEIAAALDISLKTVEAHITKITKIMRRHLRDYL
jgi:RNA polymerase sigma-70 factor (ECF subfamily)